MTIDELIEKLKKIREEHGNLPVWVWAELDNPLEDHMVEVNWLNSAEEQRILTILG